MSGDKGEETALKERLARASPHVRMGPDVVGAGQDPWFIAEIGNNHNGDYYLAKRLIEEAARAGAHAVKFQKRSVSDTFSRELTERAQTDNVIAGATYGEYRRALELDFDEFVALRQVAVEHGVSFFATPFDQPSVDFLEKVDIPFYKVASFDLTNLPLLSYIAAIGKPIVLSTGMATAAEVIEAVETVLAHHDRLVLLHCVSIYPTPDEDMGLDAMKWLRETFHPLPVGYSGHEKDILPSLVAVALGASVVERHFTLSRRMPGPDHGSVSVEPDEFAAMVAQSRRIRAMTAAGRGKVLLPEERSRRDKHGKSLVASTDIAAGTVITRDMVSIKSPGRGIPIRDLDKVVGRAAVDDIAADTVLDWPQIGGVNE